MTLHYNVDGEDRILDLVLNKNMIPKGYFRRFQVNGTEVVKRPTIDVSLLIILGTDSQKSKEKYQVQIVFKT